MKKRHAIEEIGLVLLYLGIGFASAQLWYRVTTYPLKFLQPGQTPPLYDWHQQMVSGLAPAPNQYRPLIPWVADLFWPLAPNGDLYFVYMLLRGLVTGATLWVFDRYLRVWFSTGAAAAGALCLAALIPFTYMPVIQESDPLNLLVFAAAFWALGRQRDAWIFPLVILGTLNRETTAMLPAVYLLARWGQDPPGRAIARTSLLGGCWALVYGTLRLGYGHHAYYTDPLMWPQNVASWGPTIIALLFLGVLWVLPWLAPKDAPPLLRRTLWLVPPFVALQYIVAYVFEVRLFLPLTPVLIPLSWWVLFPEARQTATPAASARAGARR